MFFLSSPLPIFLLLGVFFSRCIGATLPDGPSTSYASRWNVTLVLHFPHEGENFFKSLSPFLILACTFLGPLDLIVWFHVLLSVLLKFFQQFSHIPLNFSSSSSYIAPCAFLLVLRDGNRFCRCDPPQRLVPQSGIGESTQLGHGCESCALHLGVAPCLKCLGRDISFGGIRAEMPTSVDEEECGGVNIRHAPSLSFFFLSPPSFNFGLHLCFCFLSLPSVFDQVSVQIKEQITMAASTPHHEVNFCNFNNCFPNHFLRTASFLSDVWITYPDPTFIIFLFDHLCC